MVTANSLSDSKYVPMLPDGLYDIALPSNYSGYVLLFNEPDLVPITPADAAEQYDTLRLIFSQATFVVGGVIAQNYQWLGDFRDYCIANDIPVPVYWHIHGYCGAGISIANDLTWLQAAYDLVGGVFWVTEYNSFDGVRGDMEAVTRWILQQPWIERFAAYTNRNAPPTDPNGWMDLINASGQLTAIGSYYAAL